MSTIIPENSRVPTTKSILCTTYEDYQSNFEIKIYEGSNIFTKNNLFLGAFNLTGIKLLSKDSPVIEVSIAIDTVNSLFVSAEEKISKVKKSLSIIRYDQLFSNYQLEMAKKI